MAELVGWVQKSNADFVILGGDFNTDPTDNETSYNNLKSAMSSSMEDFFLDIRVKFRHQSSIIYSFAELAYPKQSNLWKS